MGIKTIYVSRKATHDKSKYMHVMSFCSLNKIHVIVCCIRKMHFNSLRFWKRTGKKQEKKIRKRNNTTVNWKKKNIFFLCVKMNLPAKECMLKGWEWNKKRVSCSSRYGTSGRKYTAHILEFLFEQIILFF